MIDRYQAIEAILRRVRATDLVLSTTGMISREVFATQDRPGNFYMLGSMGLLSSLGLGLALQTSQQRVLVLDGDGSALMNLGAMALVAVEKPGNLLHIILDNEAYESTGSQPSISSGVDLALIGERCGYPHSARVEELEGLKAALQDCEERPGPHLVLVKVGIAPVEGIPRISHLPTEIRERFKASVLPGSPAK